MPLYPFFSIIQRNSHGRYGKEKAKELRQIAGISYVLAGIIISEISDISRFDTPAKLLAFAGLEPSTFQSGNFSSDHAAMVKRGSKYLRWALLTATRLGLYER